MQKATRPKQVFVRLTRPFEIHYSRPLRKIIGFKFGDCEIPFDRIEEYLLEFLMIEVRPREVKIMADKIFFDFKDGGQNFCIPTEAVCGFRCANL